jgi:hypothetical protein
MDGLGFDRFARTVAHGVTRRQAIGLLGGGFAAALFGQRGAAAPKPGCETDDDCAGHGKKSVCNVEKGRCVKPKLCDIFEAPDCQKCFESTCVVATGTWTACATQVCTNGCFTNLETCACDDPPSTMVYCRRTGTCIHHGCGAGQLFDPHTCECRCPEPTTDCGGTCVDTQTDSSNCGECGHACPSTQNCGFGVCSCAEGFKIPCPPDGHCVDTSNDPKNCGGCGISCTEAHNPDCLGGHCGCASDVTCTRGEKSWCCTAVLPNGNCCCNGTITWPGSGQTVCNPCPSDEQLCYCNDGIGGWACCANGCGGCTGDGNSGLARCA